MAYNSVLYLYITDKEMYGRIVAAFNQYNETHPEQVGWPHTQYPGVIDASVWHLRDSAEILNQLGLTEVTVLEYPWLTTGTVKKL